MRPAAPRAPTLQTNESLSLQLPPKTRRPRLLAAVPARRFDRRRRNRRLLGGRRGRAGPRRRRGRQAIRFLRDLSDIQGEILLLARPNDGDACLTGATQGAQNLLAAVFVIERRTVYGGHLVPGPQAEAHEGGAVAPRVDPKALRAAVVRD